MNKKICLFIFFLAAVAGFCQKSTFCVKVVEKYQDTAIPKVIITLYKNNKKVAAGTSDAKGDYCFENISPGTYRVATYYKGYASARIEKLVVKENMVGTGKLIIAPCIRGDK